ncbi:phytanoyl-CoA dioxygenase family protein [Candidatus Pelagibacter sp.]|nr:phytanoyl-CoA dioxygenase family protein [Candidatus Pelagibacter sp.]
MNNIDKDFEKNGYIIVPGKKILLEKLRKIIFLSIKDNKNINIGRYKEENISKIFNNLHKKIKLKDLNNFRFNIYNKINSVAQFSEYFYSIAKDYLDILVGNELSMQKKINLSIQIPNDKDSLLDLHSDIYAGESPFQVVVWMPLVDTYETKSMFFTKPKHNKKMNDQLLNTDKFTTKEMYSKNKKNFKFLNIKFGDILVFSPLMLHGNTINKTKETRFSLNCRFKSLLSPYDVLVKSHRNIPNFYKPLNVKPLTKIGFNYIKKYQD